MVAAHIELGRAGEERAADWYRALGYRVIDRNWRAPIGEIDLVVRKRHTVVIVEVKTRRTDAYGAPALAVDVAKQRRLRRLAVAWLAEHRIRGRLEIRFDVVSITGDRVDVYESAF